jgi:hypothetical protein
MQVNICRWLKPTTVQNLRALHAFALRLCELRVRPCAVRAGRKWHYVVDAESGRPVCVYIPRCTRGSVDTGKSAAQACVRTLFVLANSTQEGK